MIRPFCAAAAALTLSTFIGVSPVMADETGHIKLELNALEGADQTCRLTFLVVNNQPTAIDTLVYETVIFNKAGQVDRLTLFDFGALPVSRPRVRQFELQDIACADLGQVLINGTHACTGADLPAGACDSDLRLGTRTDAELIG